MTQILKTSRVVIVGAGLGALYAALELAPRPVLMISPETLGEGASSAWAQGGIAAAMDLSDSAEAHAADTIGAGAGTVDPKVAALVTSHAREHIVDLTEKGTPFDRTPEGDYVMSLEAAHSKARVVRVKGDQAGHQIMETLIARVRATPSVQVAEKTLATGLEVEDGKVVGVWVRASGEGRGPVLIKTPAVLLAGGGSGGLFAHTTNPPRIRGQVIGFAARAGAVIADAEFVQFHPTAMDVGEDPAPLATEALRGEGAHLVNNRGARFMLALDPRELGVLFLALLLPFTADRQDALVHVNFDVLGIHTRNVRMDDKARGLLLDVHAWRPVGGDDTGLVTVFIAEELVEELLHFLGKLTVLRIAETTQSHDRIPCFVGAVWPPMATI